MRILMLLIIAVLVGCEPKPESGKPIAAPVGKVLGPGDAAPPLKVTRWLQGNPVSIQPGKVYVIEFWATWCSPCVAAMPHLDELAQEYASKGVEFLALSSLDDRGNDLRNVERYMKITGHRYKLNFAWCDSEETIAAWMGAANRIGIPCSFVIDKTGKIAFIGHPAELDDVLPRVLAGTWKGRDDLLAAEARDARSRAIFERVKLAGRDEEEKLPAGEPDPVRVKAYTAGMAKAAPYALEEIDAFAREFPKKAVEDDFRLQTMVLCLYVHRYDDARKHAEAILAHGRKTHDEQHAVSIFMHWLDPLLNPDRKHPELPLAAAELVLSLRGEDDLQATLGVAEALALNGKTDAFAVMAAKARKLCEGDPTKLAKVNEKLKSFVK